MSYSSQLDLFSVTCNFSGKNKLSTFPTQIILSVSKNNSTLYLTKMKLLQEFCESPKHKFTKNYISCSMLLHYVHGPANHSRCGLNKCRRNCLYPAPMND